nr:hypothetical protein Q903MT_gene3168 [Picea sitchensis]
MCTYPNPRRGVSPLCCNDSYYVIMMLHVVYSISGSTGIKMVARFRVLNS